MPLYYGSAVMLRVLQVDLNTLKSVALIGIIHGIAEVIERSIVVLIDYINYQICERRCISWGSFRTARRDRLATDIAAKQYWSWFSRLRSPQQFHWL